MFRRLALALIAAPFLLAALVACAVGVASVAAPTPQGGFAGTYIWRSDDPAFGGFSGIEMAEDGLSLTILSDRAAWTTARLTREDGRITGAEAAPVRPLLDRDGNPLKREFADSEGLAIAPDGTVFVSFELFSRVMRFASLEEGGHRLALHEDFKTFGLNSALESLAIDADGALYTMPEKPADDGDSFPVYRLRGEQWDIPFTLPRRGRFLIAGADIFEGHLYVLERAFWGIGFSSRVRRFDLTGGDETVVMQSRLGQFDNLEGISVWRDGGDVVLSMISDDNFLPVQRTEIVEYRLPD